jgi:hypothetical protein
MCLKGRRFIYRLDLTVMSRDYNHLQFAIWLFNECFSLKREVYSHSLNGLKQEG